MTHVTADGPLLRTGADALELIYADDADILVVPAERLDPAFFDLSSGVAGARPARRLITSMLSRAGSSDRTTRGAACHRVPGACCRCH